MSEDAGRAAAAPQSAPSPSTEPRFELDHLVVAASSLEAGRAWCRAVLGAEPQTGGAHPTMGTHNLLLGIGSARFPRAYLEIIAIDPAAPAPAHRRWFDLDAPALRAHIEAGPALVHWVARSRAIEADTAWLGLAGHAPGTPTRLERATENGPLRWRITLRADGIRPAGGAVPLLIAWSGAHPADRLPESGVRLEAIEIGGVGSDLATLLGAGGPAGSVGRLSAAAAAPLTAELGTLLGRVRLAVPRLGD